MHEALLESFLGAISASYKKYQNHGARSNEKLKPLHAWVAKQIINRLGGEYSVNSLGIGGDTEGKVGGKYYEKRVDIGILKQNTILAVISIKFVTSNLKQNVNNYFENMLGETSNIRRASVSFTHLLVLQARTPYKKRDGSVSANQALTQKDLSKYIKLYKDGDFPHRPEALCIPIIDIDEKGGARFADLSTLNLEDETLTLLQNDLSLPVFLEKVVQLCQKTARK